MFSCSCCGKSFEHDYNRDMHCRMVCEHKVHSYKEIDTPISINMSENLLDNPENNLCQEKAKQWEIENSPHFRSIFCLQPVKHGKRQSTINSSYERISSNISNSLDDFNYKEPLCVLDKGRK